MPEKNNQVVSPLDHSSFHRRRAPFCCRFGCTVPVCITQNSTVKTTTLAMQCDNEKKDMLKRSWAYFVTTCYVSNETLVGQYVWVQVQNSSMAQLLCLAIDLEATVQAACNSLGDMNFDWCHENSVMALGLVLLGMLVAVVGTRDIDSDHCLG